VEKDFSHKHTPDSKGVNRLIPTDLNSLNSLPDLWAFFRQPKHQPTVSPLCFQLVWNKWFKPIIKTTWTSLLTRQRKLGTTYPV